MGSLELDVKQVFNFVSEQEIYSLKGLTEEANKALHEKTEGWITGLRLAALSLRHTDDVARVAAGLPDANRYVLDYFISEIISQQPRDIQEILLRTSILDRFCAPLCDESGIFTRNLEPDFDVPTSLWKVGYWYNTR